VKQVAGLASPLDLPSGLNSTSTNWYGSDPHAIAAGETGWGRGTGPVPVTRTDAVTMEGAWLSNDVAPVTSTRLGIRIRAGSGGQSTMGIGRRDKPRCAGFGMEPDRFLGIPVLLAPDVTDVFVSELLWVAVCPDVVIALGSAMYTDAARGANRESRPE
jgi:hypothetical protein